MTDGTDNGMFREFSDYEVYEMKPEELVALVSPAPQDTFAQASQQVQHFRSERDAALSQLECQQATNVELNRKLMEARAESEAVKQAKEEAIADNRRIVGNINQVLARNEELLTEEQNARRDRDAWSAKCAELMTEIGRLRDQAEYFEAEAKRLADGPPTALEPRDVADVFLARNKLTDHVMRAQLTELIRRARWDGRQELKAVLQPSSEPEHNPFREMRGDPRRIGK